MTRVLIIAVALFLGSPVAEAKKIPWRLSKAKVVEQSLDQLLNDGWQVIQGSMGFEGFVVTLRRRDKVVLCEWSPHGEAESGRSRCFELN